jgi:uncharacterized protein YjbI with pentapeptide repeats
MKVKFLNGEELEIELKSYAYLRGANLRGANLRDANLSGANLSEHIITLDRIGSGKRRTIYNPTKNIIWCGCFTGTFEEFQEKIKKEYGSNNVYYKEYMACVEYFKTIAGIERNGLK